jgi:hypothetical protein
MEQGLTLLYLRSHIQIPRRKRTISLEILEDAHRQRLGRRGPGQ